MAARKKLEITGRWNARMPAGVEEAELGMTGEAIRLPTESDPADPAWTAIRSHLEGIRASVHQELLAYPRPIAGCDVQSQHLSEARDGLSRELRRLDSVRGTGAAGRGGASAIDAFIRSSPYIDDAAARKIRAGP